MNYNFYQLQSTINSYSKKLACGYIVEKELKEIIRELPVLIESLDFLKALNERIAERNPGDNNAVSRLAILNDLQEKIITIEKLCNRAEKAINQFNEAIKAPKKSDSTKLIESSETPDISNLPNELLTNIFNHFSFYEKQKYRRVSKKIHNAIENSYIKETTLVYPLADKKIVFFIDLIKTTPNITIHQYFEYLKGNRINFEELFNRLSQPQISQIVSTQFAKPFEITASFLGANFWLHVLFLFFTDDNSPSPNDELYNVLKGLVVNYPNIILVLAMVYLATAYMIKETSLQLQQKIKYGFFFDHYPQKDRDFRNQVPTIEPTVEDNPVQYAIEQSSRLTP
jgi:hypothetical protein